MTNLELIKQLLQRLKKFSWAIIIIAIGVSIFFYYTAKQSILIYTSKATVFPLNSSTDNTVSSSTISNILGLSDAPKSFSGEASINILELANSRRTRDAVAVSRIPSMQNKMVSELLIEENNRHTGYLQNQKITPPKDISSPKDSMLLVNIASGLLRGGFQSKINKNGILELYFSNSNPEIVREVSYVYIEKLSSFYIELKKKKATFQWPFLLLNKRSTLNIRTT